MTRLIPARAGTSATDGGTIQFSCHHQRLVGARARQRHPACQADYQANGPKVERKLATSVGDDTPAAAPACSGEPASLKTGSCSPTPTTSPA